jgi:hypothetical protein
MEKLKTRNKIKVHFSKKTTTKELDELKRKIKIDCRNEFVKKMILFLIISFIAVGIFNLILKT